jgi:hypothetical protein
VSDSSQGPGWWQASDGKWYPPEQAPGYQQPATPAGGPYGAPYGGGPAGGANVDVGAAFSYGWNKFVENIGDIIIIWLIVIAVQVVFGILGRSVSGIFATLVVQAVGFIVSAIAQIGLVRVGLLITAGRKPTPQEAFKTDQLGPYIIVAILTGIGVFIGFFALCIGAIIVAFLLYFAPYYVLDQRQDPVAALQSSFQLTTKNFGTVGVFALLAFIVSFCTCGLAAPIVQIGAAYLYRNLNGQPVAP